MKHEWAGNEKTSGGWAVFSVEGKVTTRIYFNEFSDYWKIIGIIDQEVKRKLGASVGAIRGLADKLEDETWV